MTTDVENKDPATPFGCPKCGGILRVTRTKKLQKCVVRMRVCNGCNTPQTSVEHLRTDAAKTLLDVAKSHG